MTGMELATSWAKALAADENIAALCAEHCAKNLTVAVGYDAAAEFGVSDAPYVYIVPVEEHGGPEAERREFSMALFMGVKVKAKDIVQDGVIINPAMHVMDTIFAPAVMEALQGLETPPLAGEGTLWPAENGYCEKAMTLSYGEDQSIFNKKPWK